MEIESQQIVDKTQYILCQVCIHWKAGQQAKNSSCDKLYWFQMLKEELAIRKMLRLNYTHTFIIDLLCIKQKNKVHK